MWNVLTKDNKNYPDTDRIVVGYYIECEWPYVNQCRYIRDKGIWLDCCNIICNAPDYWTETPENEEKNERLDRK